MNYYPFHLGDYAAHTAHLEPMEDLAYRRMLDAYYLNERALPGDAAKVARLIRLPKFLSVVEVVLAEFFELSEDGYHNKRADAELTLMVAKQEQQSTKDAHEAERMRRFRERRAQMFEALRAVNVVPAWDVPMKELQRLFDENCNEPETNLQREQVRTGNADATAIPTPTPTPTPTPERKTPRKRAAAAQLVSVDAMVAEGVDPQHAADWLVARAKKTLPLTPTAWQQTKEEAAKANLTIAEAIKTAAGNGWAGFKAAWLAADRSANGASRLQHETPRQAAAIDRVIEMTGGMLNARRLAPKEHIDAEHTDIPALG